MSSWSASVPGMGLRASQCPPESSQTEPSSHATMVVWSRPAPLTATPATRLARRSGMNKSGPKGCSRIGRTAFSAAFVACRCCSRNGRIASSVAFAACRCCSRNGRIVFSAAFAACRCCSRIGRTAFWAAFTASAICRFCSSVGSALESVAARSRASFDCFPAIFISFTWTGFLFPCAPGLLPRQLERYSRTRPRRDGQVSQLLLLRRCLRVRPWRHRRWLRRRRPLRMYRPLLWNLLGNRHRPKRRFGLHRTHPLRSHSTSPCPRGGHRASPSAQIQST